MRGRERLQQVAQSERGTKQRRARRAHRHTRTHVPSSDLTRQQTRQDKLRRIITAAADKLKMLVSSQETGLEAHAQTQMLALNATNTERLGNLSSFGLEETGKVDSEKDEFEAWQQVGS